MSRLVDTLREARMEMEKLAAASDRVSESLSPQGGGAPAGPSSGSPQATPVVVNYHETFTTNVAPMKGGSGGGGNGLEEQDEFLKFIKTRGIFDIQKANEQTLRALKLEFEFIVNRAIQKAGGLAMRQMGMS